MKLIAPIVVGIDGSPGGNIALRWAAKEAVLHKRPLRIVFVLALSSQFRPAMGSALPSSSPFVLAAEQILETGADLARSIVAEAVPVTTAVEHGSPSPVLLRESKDAYLVVLGSHGHGAFSTAILGSVSSTLVRHGHCPIAVIRESNSSSIPWSERPVLVGVDGTANSEPAIGVAMEEASRRGVPVQALYAWRDLSGQVALTGDWESAVTTQRIALAESLAGWQEQFPEVEIDRVVVPDNPVRNLVEYARYAQLVVVGNRGRGGFAGLMLGSTSQALIQAAECPVIVVRKD